MYSTYGSAKIENLQIMYDQGLFDSSFLYEMLEQINQLNRNLYVQKNSKGFDWQVLRKKSEEFVGQQYDYIIKNWKVLKKEYWNTSFNLLPKDVKDDFVWIDRLLDAVVVCKRIVQLHQFTQNPVQLNYEEMRCVKLVTDEVKRLEYYMFDFNV